MESAVCAPPSPSRSPTPARVGAGTLYEEFLRLRARLEAQGLFDPLRKRPIPAYPQALGIVTSLGAAALADVLTALARRAPHLRVVLYPTNVVKNNHMIRLHGLRHAFIGHGDSDKAGSFSPVTRVYDEIWVAGEAGRDRYVTAGEGVRPEQVRLVSRPQTAGLVRRPVGAGPVPTVLYAPTWEGFYDESDYCSVAAPGLEAVVLGGCFGPLAPWLVEPVRETLTERSLAARSGSFTVLPSAFGDGAAVRGAAAISLRRVLDAPWVVAPAARESRSGSHATTGRRGREREVAIGRR